ncbi:MAG: signal recognition particle-docking protein FtsY [Chlamydiota bacterium]
MFQSIRRTLKRIHSSFTSFRSELGKKIRALFSGKVDESSFEQLEQLFFEADLGAELSLHLVDKIRALHQENPQIATEQVLAKVREELLKILRPSAPFPALKPLHVILVVGVNGAGKTTTIAKLAHHYKTQGKKVLISASDTFRAAAVEQLDHWAKKLGVDIVKSAPKADPASVAFDALSSAQAKGCDILLVDTAGRLHTKTDLMHELEKICRTLQKKLPSAPHETFLVVDACSGQNALDQAAIFHEYARISSLVLTKLDGSAKGGVVVALKHQKNLDVRFVGLGESEEDLVPFDPEAFVSALLQP